MLCPTCLIVLPLLGTWISIQTRPSESLSCAFSVNSLCWIDTSTAERQQEQTLKPLLKIKTLWPICGGLEGHIAVQMENLVRSNNWQKLAAHGSVLKLQACSGADTATYRIILFRDEFARARLNYTLVVQM